MQRAGRDSSHPWDRKHVRYYKIARLPPTAFSSMVEIQSIAMADKSAKASPFMKHNPDTLAKQLYDHHSPFISAHRNAWLP